MLDQLLICLINLVRAIELILKTASQSDPLLKIVPDDYLVAEVDIPDKDIGFVRTGMKTDVRIDSAVNQRSVENFCNNPQIAFEWKLSNGRKARSKPLIELDPTFPQSTTPLSLPLQNYHSTRVLKNKGLR